MLRDGGNMRGQIYERAAVRENGRVFETQVGWISFEGVRTTYKGAGDRSLDN